jgi:hypothetical protein
MGTKVWEGQLSPCPIVDYWKGILKHLNPLLLPLEDPDFFFAINNQVTAV